MKEIAYAQSGIAAEDSGRHWEWAWRTCHMNLLDYYIPIRTKNDSDSLPTILAVLIVGHGRADGDDSLESIHRRVDEICTGPDQRLYFPNSSRDEIRTHAEVLHGLADQIPVIGTDERTAIDQQIQQTVALMEVIASRTLQRGILFEGEQFIQQLGLDKVSLGIVETALWHDVAEAMQKTVNYLNLASATVYASTSHNYSVLERKIVVPSSLEVPTQIGLPGYETFEELETNGVVAIPDSNPLFSWLDPHQYFAAERALLFGREMVGGHLVLVAFGVAPETRLSPFKEAILHEIVHERTFRYLMSGLLGIELDRLMAETGHLLGRARASVQAGLDSVRRAHPQAINTKDMDFLEKGLASIEDGSMSLKLIRANFYAFHGWRRGENIDDLYERERDLPQLAPLGDHVEQQKPFDAISVLSGLKPYFDRRVRHANKRIEYRIMCQEAIVQGSDDDLALVFINLIDNAEKFSYADTYVSIHASKRNGTFVVEITNLGVGVAPDETTLVFQPLRKSRFRDVVKRTEGLGLGLSYCRRVIEDEFNGHITLASQPAPMPRARKADGDNWLTTVTLQIPLFVKDD